jgi:DNA polymerase
MAVRRSPPRAIGRASGAGAHAPVTDASIAELRREARDCRACPLWAPATQTVFGEGPDNARIVVIGEQPGDKEDLSGHPFVGPAGQLFDRALAELGIARERLYVTNTVKHFKFEPRGKRRLHKRANAAEQAACRIWLEAELLHLKPRRIVCLGAMAAQAILGRTFRLMRQRGEWIELESGARAMATVHPSYLLRLREEGERERAYAQFLRDLSLLRG